tara:strand:+ start:1106 stop:1510 length:405 start_codon:yes stop_codon:yes gene_type:complete
MKKNIYQKISQLHIYNFFGMSQGKRNFFEDVYSVVKKIPFGKVTSYGSIAKYIGSPQSSRMVGWAMNSSHNIHDVPAHRVVNRQGLLTGKHHFEGTNLMQQLLESEGIKVHENKILNFSSVYWDPVINLPPFKK